MMSERKSRSQPEEDLPPLKEEIVSLAEDHLTEEEEIDTEEEELVTEEEELELELEGGTEAEVIENDDLGEETLAHLKQEVSSSNALVSGSSRHLARFDPMQVYINEAKRYPLLTPEEEHELAVRYVETGDLEIARRLVTSNLRLVVKIAHEYRKAYRNLLDLVQEGNIGLMHAVRKFDPYRGVRLSSYSAWWIRAYILKFILNNWRLVKIGTTQAQRKLFFKLHQEMERLEALGVEHVGPKLLAQNLDVSEKDVVSMQKRLASSDLSLDAPIRANEEGSATRIEYVVDHSANPDEDVENREFSAILQEKLKEFGASLKGRDREIFQLRTLASEPLTLQDIGDRYGITRERARQIERRMMDRLRDYLRQEMGDAVDVALGISEQES